MSSISTVSLRAFAKLIGVQPPTVSQACASGRLKACVHRDPDTGRVSGIDPVVGLLEWRKNTDVTKAPPAQQARSAERMARIDAIAPAVVEGAPPLDVMEGAAAGKHWDAKLKEAKYRSLIRELVPAADVEAQLRGVFSQCKTRLLAIPSRAKQEMPHLSIDDVAKLRTLIREACEDLAYSAGEAPTVPGVVGNLGGAYPADEDDPTVPPEMLERAGALAAVSVEVVEEDPAFVDPDHFEVEP